MRTVLVFLAAVSLASVAALATGTRVASAAFPSCPTQAQLAARGAKAGQVTSAAQVSTEKFPLTATVIVPAEQCSYQGTLGLLLLYFHLTAKQAAATQAHLSYECTAKSKKCTTFVFKGSNTEVTTNAATGKSKTTTVTTLNVIVTSGTVEGEVSGKVAPVSDSQCELLARAFYLYLGDLDPAKNLSPHSCSSSH